MPSPESIAARKLLHKEQVDRSLSLDAERASWNDHSSKLPLSPLVDLELKTLAGVTCAFLTPQHGTPHRIIIYAHGGGLTAGSILTHRAFASELALELDSVVVVPQYRLLPEHPPNAPSDDLIGVYLAILKTCDQSGQTCFFGGDSSGAGLAITAMVRLREKGLPQPKACFSISGAFDATLSSDSICERDARDPILSEAVLRHWQTQFSKDFNFADPLVSPLFASLSDLAPTLFLVGEDDVWFDDSVRMYDLYTQAGSKAELVVFEAMWHVWPMTSGLPETRQAFRHIADFLDLTFGT